MENEVKEPAPKFYISPEQYLEMERASLEKHEYYEGEIFAMAGVSNAHNDIAHNVTRLVASVAHVKGCKFYGSDFRLHIPENTLFTYPDFSIVCRETKTSYTDNLTNPSVIIEILSKSTRSYDKVRKFGLYRSIKTLKEYILIDSEFVAVGSHVRQEDNSWKLTEYKSLSDTFYISTIGLTLALKDIYDDVRFINARNEVKEPAPKFNYISPEQYLEMERGSQEKHEYYDGEVFALSGASWKHNVIVKNINTVILPYLKDKPCNMFGSDFRIHIPGNSFYTYPDLSIICGKLETTDKEKDTFINPAALIEVLSKSTRDNDRGRKFPLYKSIETLQEYILVDSTTVMVEIYKRNADNSWSLVEFKNLSDNFYISVIGLTLSLEDIYTGVYTNE